MVISQVGNSVHILILSQVNFILYSLKFLILQSTQSLHHLM